MTDVSKLAAELDKLVVRGNTVAMTGAVWEDYVEFVLKTLLEHWPTISAALASRVGQERDARVILDPGNGHADMTLSELVVFAIASAQSHARTQALEEAAGVAETYRNDNDNSFPTWPSAIANKIREHRTVVVGRPNG